MADSSGTTTLSYDYESRVTSITYPGGSTNTFSYNGLDTRVGKTDSSGTATYRRDGTTVTSPVLADGSATYTPGISERRSGATTYEHSDYLGSVTRQTNASQTTTATRTFDAFGLLVASTGTPQGPFGFVGVQGYQTDSDSGLMLLGHRYYDPSTGRFLTRDPAQDGRNWYVYCGNNPLNRVDATGLWSLYRWIVTGDGNASDDEYDAGLDVINGRDTTDRNGNPVRVGGWPGAFNRSDNAMTYDGTIHLKDEDSFNHYNNDQHWQDHEEGHLVQDFSLWRHGLSYAALWLSSAIDEAQGIYPISDPIGHDHNLWEVLAERYAYEKEGVR